VKPGREASGRERQARNSVTAAWPALILGCLSVSTAAGLVGLAVMHLGVEILALAGSLGIPTIPHVALLYLLLGVTFAVTAYGIFARRRWVWPTATVVFCVAYRRDCAAVGDCRVAWRFPSSTSSSPLSCYSLVSLSWSRQRGAEPS
jgi:hypothetical protein